MVAGKVIVEAGKRITARHVKQLEQAKIKTLEVPDDYLVGRILAHDVVDTKTGEVLAVANEELNEATLAKLRFGPDERPIGVQIFGGYGYSAEYGIERYFRNARAPIIYEGTTQIHLLNIMRQGFEFSPAGFGMKAARQGGRAVHEGRVLQVRRPGPVGGAAGGRPHRVALGVGVVGRHRDDDAIEGAAQVRRRVARDLRERHPPCRPAPRRLRQPST